MKKFPRKLLLAIGLSFVGISGTMAQQKPGNNVWSLSEAIDYAKRNNLQVQQRQLNLKINEVDLKQAKYQRLPSINAGGGYNFITGSYQNPATFSLVNDASRTANAFLSGSVPLFMGFQQTNQIKQLGYEVLASEQDLYAAQNDITIQIITSYLNILFSQELITTSELQRKTTQQQLDRSRILFKAGSVAENAVLDLEAQLANDEVNIINAQNQREISRLNLIQLLNLDKDPNFEIEIPEVPEPDVNPSFVDPNLAYEVAEQLQPQVRGADLRILSAAKALEVARGAYYPRLSLGGGINTRYSSVTELAVGRETVDAGLRRQVVYRDANGTVEEVFYFPNTFDVPVYEEYPLLDQFTDFINRQVGFSLNVPIFNGMQTRSNVQRAKLGEYSAQLNARIARNNLRQTIEQAYVDALSAQRQYAAAKQQVEALERSFQNAELRLESGVINTVDYFIIANNYRNAQSNLLQAKYEYTFKLKVLDFYQGKDISF